MAKKLLDANALFWDEEDMTGFSVGNNDSDAVDLGHASGSDLDEDRPGEVIIRTSTLTSGGSATVQYILLDCDTAAGTYAVLTPVQETTAAIAYGSVPTEIRMPIPHGARRYLKVRCAVGTAVLTAGTVTAGATK